MTWFHRPTSCHDNTALSLRTATANSCQKQSLGKPKEAVPKRVQGSGGVGEGEGPRHNTGRMWVDGQTESVMEAHTQQQRKSKERGEHEASPGGGEATEP